jgi:hypothetical protein
MFTREGGGGTPSFTEKQRPWAWPSPWYGSCPAERQIPHQYLVTSVVDPDPYPDSMGSLDPQKYKTVDKFHLLKCWMFSFEGFQQYFFNFWSSKTPYPDSLEMLDPGLQHCW